MRVLVVEPHVSNYPNPIKVKKGEVLLIGEPDTEFEGWIRAKIKDGNEGWAPIQYIEFSKNSATGVAKTDYSAFELTTYIGQQLRVILELNEWYLAETSDGVLGWVPVKTVKIA